LAHVESQQMTAPLTLSDMDVRDLDGFMLNVERLLASELWALTKDNPLAFRGAVGLWARAWKQIPPASLPNDEAVIAAFADMPLAKFRKCRELVMRGFELCSDGRYYHRHLAAEVNKIWPSVAKKRRDRAADNERLKQWRDKRKGGNETPSETVDETRFKTPEKPVANGVDTDRDTDRDITSKQIVTRAPQAAAPSKPKRIRRSLPDQFPLEDNFGWAIAHWRQAGRNDLCEAIREEAEKFRDHHTSKATASADWPGSWRTWVRNAIKFNREVFRETSNRNGRRASAHDNHNAGTLLYLNSLGPDADEAGEGPGSGDVGPACLPLLAS